MARAPGVQLQNPTPCRETVLQLHTPAHIRAPLLTVLPLRRCTAPPQHTTHQGVIRRGLQVEALREYIIGQGASKNVTYQVCVALSCSRAAERRPRDARWSGESPASRALPLQPVT
jgi:hypothetical protein